MKSGATLMLLSSVFCPGAREEQRCDWIEIEGGIGISEALWVQMEAPS